MHSTLNNIVARESQSARPGWTTRFLAVAFYLGLVPLLRPFRSRRANPFVEHHAIQALMIILMLLVICAGGFMYWALLTYLILYQRQLYEGLPGIDGLAAPVRDGIPLAMMILVWLLAWLSGVVLAVRGSILPLPLVVRLARRPRLLRIALVGNGFLLAGVLLTTSMTLHASSLTREDDAPSPVYLLYDDMSGLAPRWVFNLGFYRMSQAATTRWGPGSVVVAPLDERHLRLALCHGRLVFLACHGQDGDIVTPTLWVVPAIIPGPGIEETPRHVYAATHDGTNGPGPWIALEAGDGLQFVYNAACDSGCKADQWERGLAPAEVKTFNRLTTVAEHIQWLWFLGPERIQEIE